MVRDQLSHWHMLLRPKLVPVCILMMRWPLRNQIFLPFAGLLTASVILVTVVVAWNAAETSRRQRIEHMESVAAALGNANFPLTQPVVERIAAMINGDVVVLDRGGRVTATTIASTETLQPKLTVLTSLEDEELFSHSLSWENRKYLVTAIRRTDVPRPGALFVMIPQEEFSALRSESIVPPLLVAVPTLMLALILAMLISRRIGGRVDRLRELFRGLSQGEFQLVSVSGRNDEIRDLLASANELSGQLNRLQQELLRTERLQLLGQLSGGLAHQLRNSITGAKMAIQLHERSCNAKDISMLATAIAQLRLTEEQVLAVLSLRPGANQLDSAGCFDLQTLVEEVAILLRPQCEHWHTTLTVTNDCNGEKATLTSAACVKGAILNLVLNAIQAAGIGGKVKIQISYQHQQHVLEILDSGPGFELDATELSEAFATTKADGIGLGLTIAQHAVQQESGQMQIERTDDWTSVRICIPKKQSATAKGPR